MMINLTALLSIAGGIILVFGSVVTFFVMQNTQNMRITALEKDVNDLKILTNKHGDNIILNSKIIGEINIKLDHILQAIAELKKKGIKG